MLGRPDEDELRVDAVVAPQLGGVLDDGTRPARLLKVLEQERDAHEQLSYARVRRHDLPYALPHPGAPVRVAFVGQRTYFEACSLAAPAAGLVPAFVDYRGGAETAPMLGALRRLDPHVVVVFRPEILPPGTMDAIAAPVVGFVTEPLPRPGRAAHRNHEYNLAELRRVDRGNVDRAILFDAGSWDAAAELLPVWRAMPLPVDDRLYHAPTPSRRPPRIIFVGYSTMHREQSILGLKHEFDLPHYAHGLMGAELDAVLAGADVGLNVHGEEGLPTFENRVLLHLAAGSLVISEVLEPPYGLEPNRDVLQVLNRDELGLRVRQLHRMPDLHDRIRIRGHHTSRRFAASKVWPRVIADLFADLRAFGTDRRPAAAAATTAAA
ncbi:MAG: hypothetical protein JWP53_1895 [Conexibacter sp.]|nr:hypothetical protein [Conexibacter sp.]